MIIQALLKIFKSLNFRFLKTKLDLKLFNEVLNIKILKIYCFWNWSKIEKSEIIKLWTN